MQNIKLEIQYDGTKFYGWEIQPNKRTVRGVLESALEKILNEKIKLSCGARTDAGVHAIAQIANFKTRGIIKPEKIKRALFKLPQDIYVKSVTKVFWEFNAHFDAMSRTYLYRMILDKSPIMRAMAWEYKFPLDVEKVNKILPLFVGIHRFDMFSHKDTGECHIKKFTMTHNNNEVIFEISANHFLRRMVRMVIGTTTEFGRGKLTEKHIKTAIDCKKGTTKYLAAPPQGLYLKDIEYPIIKCNQASA